MRPLGLVLIALGLVAFGASRLAPFATLDVLLVVAGIVLVLAGIGLLIFGRGSGGRRSERREPRPPAVSRPPLAPGSGDRAMSSPVPLGARAEAGAQPGTGTSAPAPIVQSDELPGPSTAGANLAPPMPAAPPLDDGPHDVVERHAEQRRGLQASTRPVTDDRSDRRG